MKKVVIIGSTGSIGQQTIDVLKDESSIEIFGLTAGKNLEKHKSQVLELNPKYYDNLEKMGIEWTDPWEKPLHKIYETIPCFSPVPSLAIHCANINSIFGISPLIDVKKLWKENES